MQKKVLLCTKTSTIRASDWCFVRAPHRHRDLQKSPVRQHRMTGTNVDFILKGINEYLMALAKEQIKLAFEQSEKEVSDLHQRTREGLLTARLNGKQVGRKKGTGFETQKSKAAKEKIRVHCKAFGGTLDDMECMKLTGLARNTYYKYKRQIRADLTDEGNLKRKSCYAKRKIV